MNQQPLISVILPAYNSEDYIVEALESIINQTYDNLEIIVINDGSTDRTVEKIKSLNDDRINLITNEVNLGLIKTLNKGILLSSGKYIARMDADDIAMSSRLEKQAAFLEKNPDYGLCASWYETFGGYKKLGKNKVEDVDIKIRLLHQCHICHPTVILRRSVIEQFNIQYSNNFPHSEDYALWVEMTDKTKFHTYPEILLKYRDHESNISKTESLTQEELSIKVKNRIFLSWAVQWNLMRFYYILSSLMLISHYPLKK
jgi:glycosyltransferase involved in cell wall biosynthesis